MCLFHILYLSQGFVNRLGLFFSKFIYEAPSFLINFFLNFFQIIQLSLSLLRIFVLIVFEYFNLTIYISLSFISDFGLCLVKVIFIRLVIFKRLEWIPSIEKFILLFLLDFFYKLFSLPRSFVLIFSKFFNLFVQLGLCSAIWKATSSWIMNFFDLSLDFISLCM